MTDLERAFYVLDYATDIKVMCEKGENLNKELKQKQKQVFNRFLANARALLKEFEKSIPIDDESFLSMEDFKYNVTTELKKQFTEQIDK